MFEELEKITLDKESIKALGADTRINILKILSEKQQTLSDLSQLLELSAPTLKEHLNVLEKVQMIKKLEEGRKWKYYKITDKGLSLLYPERKRIFLTLTTLTISALGIAGSFFLSNISKMAESTFSAAPTMLQKTEGLANSAAPVLNSAARDTTKTLYSSFFSIPRISTLIFIILFLISLFFLIYFITKYKTRKEKYKKLIIGKQKRLNSFIK